ncbi:hypothetical protein ABFG93_04760 [Pseudalkalibacillus hwajinpoensis]|uniref:hypothetical protein n=1 Tax=Guptibacillus hwajinpoensis TaxID=208199 RepID=UPI00325B6885
MLKPFLYNHQFNVIREQVDVLLYNVNYLIDQDVLDAVRHNATDKVLGLFTSLNGDERSFLNRLRTIRYVDI